MVEQIEKILSEPFQDYWKFHNIMAELCDLGYRINHKKVYPLIKEVKLLEPSARLRPEKVDKKFVMFRKVVTKSPQECIEMDIKFVWIPDEERRLIYSRC